MAGNEIEILKSLRDLLSEIKEELKICFSKIAILEHALLSVIRQLEEKNKESENS